MDDMDDLITRLRAAIDEAERLAVAARDQPDSGWWWGPDAESAAERHIAGQNPDATLRMVAAHRALLAHAEQCCRDYDERLECGDRTMIEYGAAMYEVIYQLAAGYGIERPRMPDWPHDDRA